jgi:hypothetical protein
MIDEKSSTNEISNKEILEALKKRWGEEDSRYLWSKYYHFAELLIALGLSFFGIGIGLETIPNENPSIFNLYIEIGAAFFGLGVFFLAAPFCNDRIRKIYSMLKNDFGKKKV